MSKEVKRREFEIRDSLKDAGVKKIIAEIEDNGSNPKNIIVEHDKGDKRPIVIAVTRQWYGDTRETFKTLAEKYFIPEVVLQLERDIGAFHLQIFDEVAKEQEKQATEARQRAKEARARILSGLGEQPLPETESVITTISPWGDDHRPISVKQALYAPPGTMVTVQGQVVAKGKVHHMIEGGMYRCMRCHQLNPVIFERPLSPTDMIPEVWRDMCINCRKDHLEENSTAYRAATTLMFQRPKTISAIRIELMDTEALDEPDNLQVAMFDNDAKNVLVGEHAVISGRIYSLHTSVRGGLFYPVLYTHHVKYVNKETYELTDKDIERAGNFKKLATEEKDPKTGQPLGEENIIRRLVFAYGRQSVIDNELAREALLYCEASAEADRIGKGSTNQRRKRINVGIVGNPGVGKTKMARVILFHDERNRFESGQSASGKSITAIVSKEGEGTPMLRIGALPHAKEAVIAINELGEMSLDEQKHLQDSWEEGQFTINKYGVRATIRADAACVWTSNPKQGAVFSDDSPDAKISIEEIPVRKQLLDRTDYLIIIKPIKDLNERREFDRKRLDIERASPARKKILANYDECVKKHLMVAKQFYQPTLSEAAAEKLIEADVRIQVEREKASLSNIGSNRALDTLMRTTIVIARLKFKHEADENDANQAIEFYNKATAQIHASIVVPEDPAVLSCNLILFILQSESKGTAMSLKSLAEIACTRDPAVRWYLMQGPKNRLGDVSTNKRLKRVLELLENVGSGKIRRTKMQPAEFLWVGSSDHNTSNDKEHESGDALHADLADLADLNQTPDVRQKAPDEVQEKRKQSAENAASHDTEMSARSAESAITDNKELEEYKILKAMELAMLGYKDSKAQGNESGSLFTPYDTWYHLSATFPEREWNLDNVRKVIRQQIAKGRVITRQGDEPDRYYLSWRDNTNGGVQT
jgi:replicative DNA helicase Mcm